MKSLKLIAYSAIGTLTACLASSLVVATPAHADEYFNNPTLKTQDGRTYKISACVTSHRFPGKYDECDTGARDVIASQFCSEKGYSTFAHWRINPVDWSKRTTAFRWNEGYRNGNYREGFFTQGDQSIFFTLITCR